MSYEALAVRNHLLALLDRAPHTSLAAAAQSLQMDRHTVQQHLAACGCTYRDLRLEALDRRYRELRAGHPELTGKQIAQMLEFPSARALYQYLHRRRGRQVA